MPILVQKYGGSSVADVEKIGAVADKIALAKRAGNDVVVVVSAMGKATDGLLALAKSAALGAGKPSEPPRRELDMLLSTGERVSMALLSIAVQARGCEAISFTGSQSGIITNDRHFDARIIEVRPHRIEDELSRGKIVIVAGYQGMSYRREITTLGRGGSDTTAVALAAALGAERCEIYSDVDGVYSADPRVVPEARHLPELDYAMLQEMAEHGAKVLNAQAVEWARRAKIAIHARASFQPGRETIARSFEGENERAVRAIVGERDVVLGRYQGEAPRLLRALETTNLPLREVSIAAGATTFFVPKLNVPDWGRARHAIEAELGCSISLTEGLGIVSVIGDSLASPAAIARFCAAISAVAEAPRHLTASPLRISATIDAARLDEAQRALHASFVSER